MNSIEQRLVTAAREVGIELSAETLADPAALASLAQRIERSLTWPSWENYRDRGQVDSLGKDEPGAVTGSAAGEPVSSVVEEALAQARLATEGGAYTYIDGDEARTTARKIDEVGRGGPLTGMTLAVKDLIAVAGRPLRAGSAIRDDAPEEPRDAPVVANLRRAGAVLIGTTTLHEIAFGVTGINDHGGTTANPHDPSRVAGGSSSGSAVAVAEGSARIALGTDTGGSVRIPAALCGVVGFKPGFGTYPTQGVFPLSPTLDHVGLLAKSMAGVQAGHASLGQPVEAMVRPARVGVVRTDLAQCEPPVRLRFESVLQRLAEAGCTLLDAVWPESEAVFVASTAIMFSEAAAVHRREMSRDASRYGPDVRARLLQGLAIPAATYVTALRERERLAGRVQATLAGLGCVIGPTVGMVAPTLDEARDPAVSGRLVAFTRLANLVGVPALSLPIPGDGLPVGLQIISARESRLLGIGAFLEEVLASP